MARALDAKEEEWEELAAASPDDDLLQAKAKFHTEVLDDRSQIQDYVNIPYEATSDEELFIALTEQADAAYAEEGYDASARYRCCAEVLSESLPQWMETPDREMLAEAGVDPRSLAPGDEPQAGAVLAQAGLDADNEASDHWLQSNFEQLQAVLACCSPIALPARRRRACRLRDTRFRSR
jgi:hypothetical protein